MGSNSGEEDEQPIHDVYLDAFWIDKYEVSKTMYARFDTSQSPGNEPVRDVSWEQASAYCVWAGSRLPTEAEWEKAAHGFSRAIYPWGNQPPRGELVNFADINSKLSWEDTNIDDGYITHAPVSAYPAGMSAYGSLNMAGNVAEWVNDWYEETYYSISPLDNPRGPADGFFRVVRGGSYTSTAAGIRSSERNWYIAEGGAEHIGFRCAQSTIFP